MEDSFLDTPSSPVHQPDTLVRHASGILSVVSLLFAGLLILTYGTGAAFRSIRVIFTAFILLTHSVSIAKFFINGAYAEKNIQKTLFLSSDVHYFTFFILLTVADMTPILTIVNYIIALASSVVNYLVSDIFSLVGQTDNDVIEKAKGFASHRAVTFVPVYLELMLIFQLFLIIAADWTLINLFTFAVYIAWIVMFNYATSSPHKQVWTSIGVWIGSLVDANQNSFGPILARITETAARLGPIALNWYK